MADNNRNAKGGGSVRQRPDGKWEARCTINGKRQSFYADKQNEALKKMRKALEDNDEGIYFEPTRATFGQWLNTWLEEYSKPHIKETTYKTRKRRIKPIQKKLGQIALQKLNTMQIQHFYNELIKNGKHTTSTIRQFHATIRMSLNHALKMHYIKTNPAENCVLPKKQSFKITAFSQKQINAFLEEIQCHRFKHLYTVTLFTGMRLGEVLGLSWDCIDFKKETLTIRQQRQKDPQRIVQSTKSGKSRTLSPAPFVMDILKVVRQEQIKDHLAAGTAWQNTDNLVFVDNIGHPPSHDVIGREFKKIVRKMDCPDFRFHDLRHTYAVMSLQAGDDPKTVQENLGHATAAFTLDVYAHVTEDMKKASAIRMQSFYGQLQKKA